MSNRIVWKPVNLPINVKERVKLNASKKQYAIWEYLNYLMNWEEEENQKFI